MTAIQKSGNAIASAARTTWSDSETGVFSLTHFGQVLTLGVLCLAFVKNVYLGKVDGLDYIYYALAMAIASSPALARMVIKQRVMGLNPQEKGAAS